MADYEFPKAPKIEAAWRAAHKAFESLIPERHAYANESGLDITEVISQFPALAKNAEIAAAGELGPLISWEGPWNEGDWKLTMTGADFDGDLGFGPVELHDSAFTGPRDDWSGSALDQAATAYRRACGWDFAPGQAGVWLLMLAPASVFGTGSPPTSGIYSGHLVGFVILYDRDEDGSHESVGHIWTAAAWRRRGIASQLLAEAGARFGYQRVEGPYTDDGRAFLKARQAPAGAVP
jgi:ribosomal protein S18 acetylase RimI-like enzyme